MTSKIVTNFTTLKKLIYFFANLSCLASGCFLSFWSVWSKIKISWKFEKMFLIWFCSAENIRLFLHTIQKILSIINNTFFSSLFFPKWLGDIFEVQLFSYNQYGRKTWYNLLKTRIKLSNIDKSNTSYLLYFIILYFYIIYYYIFEHGKQHIFQFKFVLNRSHQYDDTNSGTIADTVGQIFSELGHFEQ